jgi:hypothetical protein
MSVMHQWIRRPLALVTGALFTGMLLAGTTAWAIDPSKGLNAAGVIDFPTALDQNTTHTIHGTVEIFDLGEPDLRAVNLRYGFQVGQLQLLADTYWQTDPKEYDHSEVKAKLRILSLDEYRTYAAFGIVARYVDKKDKEPFVIDDRRYSLFAVVSAEFYPIAKWDAMLANFYVDNRFASFGLKFPVFDFIRVVAEADYHHGLDDELAGLTDKQKERWQSKIGIELEGEQNFYVQLYYSTAGEHARLQIGTGF